MQGGIYTPDTTTEITTTTTTTLNTTTTTLDTTTTTLNTTTTTVGTTAEPMQETLDLLAAARIRVDAMRLRAFPFSDEVFEYIEQHDRVIVIEQNRDAQMRSMLMIEGDVDPARLLSVRHYAGMPVTARFLVDEITKHAQADTVPLQREA